MAPCRRPAHAVPLPSARQLLERRDVLRTVIGPLLVPRFPDLSGDGTGEHVQDLVAFVAGVKQSCCGVPDLGWRVIPQLRRDNLVHRDVQTRVDRRAPNVDLPQAGVERLLELRMLAPDHERTDVRIRELLELETQRREHVQIGDEPSSRLISITAHLRHRQDYYARARRVRHVGQRLSRLSRSWGGVLPESAVSGAWLGSWVELAVGPVVSGYFLAGSK